jgi:hypothetical protein
MQQNLQHGSMKMLQVAEENAATLRKLQEKQETERILALEGSGVTSGNADTPQETSPTGAGSLLEGRAVSGDDETGIDGKHKATEVDSSEARGRGLLVYERAGEGRGGWGDDGWMRRKLEQMETKIDNHENARLEHTRRLDAQLAELSAELRSVAKNVDRMCSSVEAAGHHMGVSTKGADMSPYAPSSSSKMYAPPLPPQHPAPPPPPLMQQQDAHMATGLRTNGYGGSMLDDATLEAIANKVAVKVGGGSRALSLHTGGFNDSGQTLPLDPTIHRTHSIPLDPAIHGGRTMQRSSAEWGMPITLTRHEDALADAVIAKLRAASFSFAGDDSLDMSVNGSHFSRPNPREAPLRPTWSGSPAGANESMRFHGMLGPLRASQEWLPAIVQVSARDYT